MPSYEQLVAVTAVAAAAPVLVAVARLPVPAPVLEILAGIVLGPGALHLVHADGTVTTVSVLGLAFLLFLAGSEVDLKRARGQVGRLAGTGLAVSGLLGLAAGLVLHGVGLVRSPGFLAVSLLATSLGLVVPVLVEASSGGVSAAEGPAGRLVIANSSLAEVAAVLLLSLLYSVSESGVGRRVLLLALFAVLLAAVALGTRRAEMSPRLSGLVSRLADTTAQLRVRLAVLLLIGTAALAAHLGLEAILGAFVAGVLLRLVDPSGEMGHPAFMVKLQALGYGFFVPVFFVTSGLTFDLTALTSAPSTLARVPVFLLCLLLVRGLPALLYRGLGGRERVAAGLLQATSLPFLVAATSIGRQLGTVSPSSAAALVAAGLLSVVLFPAVAVRLLRPAGPQSAEAAGA